MGERKEDDIETEMFQREMDEAMPIDTDVILAQTLEWEDKVRQKKAEFSKKHAARILQNPKQAKQYLAEFENFADTRLQKGDRVTLSSDYTPKGTVIEATLQGNRRFVVIEWDQDVKNIFDPVPLDAAKLVQIKHSIGQLYGGKRKSRNKRHAKRSNRKKRRKTKRRRRNGKK